MKPYDDEDKVPRSLPDRAMTVAAQNRPVHLLMIIAGQLEQLQESIERLSFAQQSTFSEQEAARYLKCSVNALKRYSLRTRQIPYCLVGRGRTYLKADLDAFLRSVRR